MFLVARGRFFPIQDFFLYSQMTLILEEEASLCAQQALFSPTEVIHPTKQKKKPAFWFVYFKLVLPSIQGLLWTFTLHCKKIWLVSVFCHCSLMWALSSYHKIHSDTALSLDVPLVPPTSEQEKGALAPPSWKLMKQSQICCPGRSHSSDVQRSR